MGLQLRLFGEKGFALIRLENSAENSATNTMRVYTHLDYLKLTKYFRYEITNHSVRPDRLVNTRCATRR